MRSSKYCQKGNAVRRERKGEGGEEVGEEGEGEGGRGGQEALFKDAPPASIGGLSVLCAAAWGQRQWGKGRLRSRGAGRQCCGGRRRRWRGWRRGETLPRGEKEGGGGEEGVYRGGTGVPGLTQYTLIRFNSADHATYAVSPAAPVVFKSMSACKLRRLETLRGLSGGGGRPRRGRSYPSHKWTRPRRWDRPRPGRGPYDRYARHASQRFL